MEVTRSIILYFASVSVFGLLLAFALRKRSADPDLFWPLAFAMAAFNGIGLVLVLEPLIPWDGGPKVGPLVMDTVILLLELGWLMGFTTFVSRLPGAKPLPRRAAGTVTGLVLLLALAGWSEFIATTRSTILDGLALFMGYGTCLGLLAGALWARSRAAAMTDGMLGRAVRALSRGVIGCVALLCLWWITAGYVRAHHPGLRDAFNAAMFLVFNGIILGWMLLHGEHLKSAAGANPRAWVPEDLAASYGISKREREIIDWIVQGKTNKEIAEGLFISVHTAKEHVARVFQKTGMRNRVQLTRLFLDARHPPTGDGPPSP